MVCNDPRYLDTRLSGSTRKCVKLIIMRRALHMFKKYWTCAWIGLNSCWTLHITDRGCKNKSQTRKRLKNLVLPILAIGKERNTWSFSVRTVRPKNFPQKTPIFSNIWRIYGDCRRKEAWFESSRNFKLSFRQPMSDVKHLPKMCSPITSRAYVSNVTMKAISVPVGISNISQY